MFTLLTLAVMIFALQLYVGEFTSNGKQVVVSRRTLTPYLEELTEFLTEEYLLPVLFSLFLLNQDVEPVQHLDGSNVVPSVCKRSDIYHLYFSELK